MSSKKHKRRNMIQQIVHERGGLTVGALAEMLDVSTQTIRRDLDKLCDGDVLRRRHGRIELAEDRLNTPFDQRAGTNLVGKRAIAEHVARQIPDGSSLFLSIGSTALSVARALGRHKQLTVITNNLSAAMTLSEEVSNRIILPGGELRLPDRDMIGEEVVTFLDRFRAEFAVFGVAGIAEDGGLLEFHPAEVRVCARMRDNAAMSILAVDRTKFGRSAPAYGGNIDTVDLVVSDRIPDALYLPIVETLDDRIVFAEGVMER
ncbi:DeoR/GlpR family DNA-binding transcription regulator [Ahrensia sp. R2A130]|uniref:DeoR/GlpR family DNA-binding transcription regulator n=1 Tax=Ahrensia sp. R2A130 TaxID=744979 RepID=UPI0001E0BC79|nr:DeoR/GlpR family DNA-binding transcription regulator [Ahrensia sp. R2A130]EFL89451.1 glycerol-3-phosphate regulon repressor [Ahrensia sp. R2A130]